MASKAIGLGAWLTIAASIGIIVAAMTPASTATNAQASREENGSVDVKPMLGEPTPKPAAVAPNVFSISAELSRLAELHTNGILSADEFQAAKARLLVPN